MNKIFGTRVAAMLVIPFAVMFQACNKDSSKGYVLLLNTAPITYAIPPHAAAVLDTFGTASNTYNIDSFIKASASTSLGLSNISSVKLASCVLTIVSGNTTAPANNTFGNFGSCFTSFFSGSNAHPYEIGVTGNPTNYALTLTMPVDTTTELKSYFSNSQFHYSLSGDLNTATTDTIICTVQYSYTMYLQG